MPDICTSFASQCEFRPNRHNAGRINAPVALVIVMLDMEDVDGLGDARQVVKLPQVAVQRRIVPDLAKIAFEVPEINRVEADQGGEQAPVGFCQSLADKEALTPEPRLEPVQRLEQLPEGLFISLLRSRKTGAIDPIVDRSIDALVDFVDLRLQAARIIVALRRANAIKRAVEYADDFRRFVVDDGVRLLVPKDWHCDPAAIVGTRLDVEFAQLARAEYRVGNDALAGIEGPAALAEEPVNDRERNHALKPFKPSEDEGAMRPRAGKRDDEVIAVGLRLEAAGAARPRLSVNSDPIAEGRVGPHETAARVVREVALSPFSVDERAHVCPRFSDAPKWRGRPGSRRTIGSQASAPPG